MVALTSHYRNLKAFVDFINSFDFLFFGFNLSNLHIGIRGKATAAAILQEGQLE